MLKFICLYKDYHSRQEHRLEECISTHITAYLYLRLNGLTEQSDNLIRPRCKIATQTQNNIHCNESKKAKSLSMYQANR